jgi:hypothetical protein
MQEQARNIHPDVATLGFTVLFEPLYVDVQCNRSTVMVLLDSSGIRGPKEASRKTGFQQVGLVNFNQVNCDSYQSIVFP